MAAPPPPEISLRKFELTDVDDYMVWASDAKVTHFCSFDPYTSKADLLDFIRDKVLPHPWFRAICLSGRPVGGISVEPSSGDEGRRRAELGYVLASEQWGKGVATAAVKMVLSTVFEDLEGLERLEALVDVANGASQRVLEKSGFRKEGVLRKFVTCKGRTRDTAIYSFLSGNGDPIPAAVGISMEERRPRIDEPERRSAAPEVTLRRFELSDASALMSWASDSRVTRFQRRGPFAREEEALAYIKEHIMNRRWYRAVCTDGRVVGSVSVQQEDGGGGGAASRGRLGLAVGYRIAYEHWGKGIATRAVAMAAAALFEESPELERVEAAVDAENPASMRVLEKAGFLREAVLRKYIVLKGEVRDMVMYSIINGE